MIISSFRGEYQFLSNFYPASVTFDEVSYPTVEHAYQAAKTWRLDKRMWVRGQTTPGKAKWAGKALPLREDWEQVKLQIMEELVLCKFTKHVGLREKLSATGDAELVEGNNWGDIFWGICNGAGGNHLGKILMKIREKLSGDC